jgi:hypothetical protein
MSAVPIYCRLGAAPPAVTAPLRHAGNEGGRARLVGTAGAGGTSPILRRGSRLGGAPARTRRRHGHGDRSSRSCRWHRADSMRTLLRLKMAAQECAVPTRPTEEVRLPMGADGLGRACNGCRSRRSVGAPPMRRAPALRGESQDPTKMQHAGPHRRRCGTIGAVCPTDAGAPSGRCCALALARPGIRLCRALSPTFPAASQRV